MGGLYTFCDLAGVAMELLPNEKPSFHKIRSLGAHLYDEQGSKAQSQALLAHADEKMTEHYLEGHKIVWNEVNGI